MEKSSQKKKILKKCIKKLRFYLDVMLTTNIMDDVEDRRKFVNIIHDLKNLKKETT